MKKLIVIATLIGVGLLPSALAAKPKHCHKNYYQGANAALLTGRYINVAKDNAVLSWGARVLTSIGPDYADWKNARNKGFRCVKQAGRYKCTARAQACTK